MYLTNIPTTIKQPNGDILHLLMSGDIYFNFLHDQGMNKIKLNKADNWYYYAIEDDVIEKIICSDVKVTKAGLGYSNPEYQPEEYQERWQARKDYLDSLNIIS